MFAAKQALLIRSAGSTQKVHQVDILDDGAFVAPLHWALRANSGFLMCLPNMTCTTAQRTQFIGLARPRDLGLPTLNHFYFLLFLVGIFTLSIPVRLRPLVTESRPITLQELVQMLIEAVRNNPAVYTCACAVEIERRLANATAFGQIRKAFGH